MTRRFHAAVISAALLALHPLRASAQQPSPDSIDRTLQACLAEPGGQTTAGTITCLDRAYKSWDREMNKVYAALLRSVAPASREKLRASQRQWLGFRDADMEFQRQEFVAGNGKYGTLASVTLMSNNVDMIRQRVTTLREYLNPD
jgi:uncharacterized protein YecT (DUF1311 family)